MKQQLHVQMTVTHRSLWQCLHEASQLCGLLPGQPRILEYLVRHPGCTRKDIGVFWGIDKSTMSGIVSRMERDGLLTAKDSPADRRHKVLTITPKGQAAYDRLQAMTAQINSRASKNIKHEDMETFLSVLAQIRANLTGFQPGENNI